MEINEFFLLLLERFRSNLIPKQINIHEIQTDSQGFSLYKTTQVYKDQTEQMFIQRLQTNQISLEDFLFFIKTLYIYYSTNDFALLLYQYMQFNTSQFLNNLSFLELLTITLEIFFVYQCYDDNIDAQSTKKYTQTKECLQKAINICLNNKIKIADISNPNDINQFLELIISFIAKSIVITHQILNLILEVLIEFITYHPCHKIQYNYFKDMIQSLFKLINNNNVEYTIQQTIYKILQQIQKITSKNRFFISHMQDLSKYFNNEEICFPPKKRRKIEGFFHNTRYLRV